MKGSQHHGFLHRNESWQKDHARKIEQTKKNCVELEANYGTFKPKINDGYKPNRGQTVMSRSGVTKYLDRLQRGETNKIINSEKAKKTSLKDSLTGNFLWK